MKLSNILLLSSSIICGNSFTISSQNNKRVSLTSNNEFIASFTRLHMSEGEDEVRDT